MSNTAEFAAQRARAETIATQLGAGPNPPQGLVRALLALVEADEKYIPDAPPRWRRPEQPAAGAKEILKPKPEPVTPRVTTKPAKTKPAQPEPEPELTLF